MNDDATNPENTAHTDDETPAVFTVKKGVQGWQLNRRDFLATAAAAAVASSTAVAGSTAVQGAGAAAPGFVRIQVLTAVQAVSAADAGPGAAPLATPMPAATPPPVKTPRSAAQDADSHAATDTAPGAARQLRNRRNDSRQYGLRARHPIHEDVAAEKQRIPTLGRKTRTSVCVGRCHECASSGQRRRTSIRRDGRRQR